MEESTKATFLRLIDLLEQLLVTNSTEWRETGASMHQVGTKDLGE
jgi:hypothetical protein